MKKLTLLAMTFVLTMGMAIAGGERPIKVNQLPQTAQKFLTTYWKDVKVTYAKMEKEGLEVIYDVYLDNKVQIEFNKKGEWTKIKSTVVPIPESIIMPQITDYVDNNFPECHIVKIKKKLMHYEVELNNDIELKFNNKGEFKKADY